MQQLNEDDRVRTGTSRQQAEVRQQRRLTAVGRQTEELSEFLESLGNRIESLQASNTILEGTLDHPPRFMDYARTRNLTSECLAFLIVIERRVDNLPEDIRGPFRDILDQRTVSLWSSLLECSLTFLRAISEEEHLPLGSREVFLREIKTLYDAHGILSRPEFEDRLPPDLLTRQRSAERILNEIIDRAPRLLDLGRPQPEEPAGEIWTGR
ncbi:hypothetical protein [Roseospira visakhapatnamensis]|uniref:Uncharacterized protein n=1 Tax=Roseospira visakhapatnamensis TaxID=390880 RepID=A0A7W6RAB2_9PROT|nr:hypothetical protein [Roseospira visakhapatnamensis]MBB4264818.1 hypothetical protein [Roseospira visakhapatnamensis]